MFYHHLNFSERAQHIFIDASFVTEEEYDCALAAASDSEFGALLYPRNGIFPLPPPPRKTVSMIHWEGVRLLLTNFVDWSCRVVGSEPGYHSVWVMLEVWHTW